MLPEPQLLNVQDGYPLHHGKLELLAGPERLETGWWDDDGIARDYYTAAQSAWHEPVGVSQPSAAW